MTSNRPNKLPAADLFDMENDELDRMLARRFPEPQPDDRWLDDQPLDDLLAEADDLLAKIRRG